MRIKEILKEKGISVQELADTLNISRQALHRQINGKLLVETAQRIATALNVPIWQLFATPDDIASTKEAGHKIKCPNCGQEFEVELKTKTK